MSASSLMLPRADGTMQPYTPGQPAAYCTPALPLKSRVVYAAAHVVSDPKADNAPGAPVQLDWDATLAYRRHLWAYGLNVAEAMDTAQRGMGLDWTTTQELIRRSLAEAKSVNGGIACGAGTDHLAPDPTRKLDDVIAAYEEQVGFVEGEGGQVILMASRALAACAQSEADYIRVYNRILSQVSRPVIIHWLGDMFDPALKGYWGSSDISAAMGVCLSIIHANASKIDGVKISLLDDRREIEMRRCLPAGVRMYTGDDFNYDRLILGDDSGYSHALLGIFDAIAPAASAAVQALDAGDTERYNTILAPTIPLSRHIFKTPTYHYKTGIVFMAYLNGHQEHFHMVGGMEMARSIAHLSELFILADQAGLLANPDLAVARMKQTLAAAGGIS
jgi:hypothetical protein